MSRIGQVYVYYNSLFFGMFLQIIFLPYINMYFLFCTKFQVMFLGS